MNRKLNLSRDQQQAGMVAIMVTLILMIVISLIVLGFAQISRRNQRQALDRQLSTQAFYAAETAVNDATKLIKSALAGGTTVNAKPTCASDGAGFYTTLNPDLDAADEVSYTCLLVNPSPASLVWGDVDSSSVIVPLKAASGTVAKINLTWQSKTGSSTPANNCPTGTSNVFTPASPAWTCDYGVLRFDLVPTVGSLTVSGLQSSTMTSFVVPLRPGSSGTANPIGYTTGGGNNLLGVVCTNANCSLSITVPNQSQYHMRISSLYKNVSLQITANDSSGGSVLLTGAQAVIDATGKAQDVLRRIQVRVPLSSNQNQLSDYAIQSSEALCKRFSVMDGFFQSDANNAVPGVGASTTNPLCQ